MKAVVDSPDAVLVERLRRSSPMSVHWAESLDDDEVSAADLVVVDVRGGLGRMGRVRERLGEHPRSLVVAVVDDAEMADRAMAAGVHHVLFADDRDERLAVYLRVAARRILLRRSFDPSLGIAVMHLGESVEVTDADGRIQYVNPAFERLTGYERSEVVGRRPSELLRSGEHDASYLDDILETVRSGKAWRGPVTSRRRDGARIEQDVTVSPVLDEQGRLDGMVAVRREVTKERALEAKLRASERMVALGTLAAGVAHEINNPLSYVLANIEHVLETLEVSEPHDPDELIEALQQAQAGGERVRRIVGDMNLLARERSDSVRVVDLGAVLDATVTVARGLIRPVAQLRREYEGRPRVLANDGRLGQVALNLLVNAAQAIPPGDDPASHHITLRAGVTGERAFFEVVDDGVGIPAKVRERIFDPFFTTKPPGEGTGLGLSVCHQIVRGYGGGIEVASELGRGTSIRVWLPHVAEEVRERKASSTPPKAQASRVLRVLVVDDEPSVCKAIARVLRPHTVEIAHGGAEALAVLGDAEIDAVICDLTMPDMTGTQLREALPAGSPIRDRWIFITGGVLSDRDRRYLESFEGPVVHKPFRAPEVRSAVASVT